MSVAVFGCFVHANIVQTNEELFGYRCTNSDHLGFNCSESIWIDMCTAIGIQPPAQCFNWRNPPETAASRQQERFRDIEYRNCAQYFRENNCLIPIDRIRDLVTKRLFHGKPATWGDWPKDMRNEPHVIAGYLQDFYDNHLIELSCRYGRNITHIGVIP